ncbi:MAG: TonB family protein [Bacteroidetes bacterium]|nr:TonB family protein [Bacteroidota bacterium]
MEIKKSNKADLENKKTIFFQLGLIFSLGICLFAFEWKSYNMPDNETFSVNAAEVFAEEVSQSQAEIPVAIPLPPQQQSSDLQIVENDEIIGTEIKIDQESMHTNSGNNNGLSENGESEVEEGEILMVVEENPSFPGGDGARIKFLQNYTLYPKIARERNIQGTVYIEFVIEKDGSVNKVKLLNSIGGGCDEEAIRIVKAMPHWIPGRQKGKAVRVLFHMPIIFSLNG